MQINLVYLLPSEKNGIQEAVILLSDYFSPAVNCILIFITIAEHFQ